MKQKESLQVVLVNPIGGRNGEKSVQFRLSHALYTKESGGIEH
jgi:hypothetical protein